MDLIIQPTNFLDTRFDEIKRQFENITDDISLELYNHQTYLKNRISRINLNMYYSELTKVIPERYQIYIRSMIENYILDSSNMFYVKILNRQALVIVYGLCADLLEFNSSTNSLVVSFDTTEVCSIPIIDYASVYKINVTDTSNPKIDLTSAEDDEFRSHDRYWITTSYPLLNLRNTKTLNINTFAIKPDFNQILGSENLEEINLANVKFITPIKVSNGVKIMEIAESDWTVVNSIELPDNLQSLVFTLMHNMDSDGEDSNFISTSNVKKITFTETEDYPIGLLRTMIQLEELEMYSVGFCSEIEQNRFAGLIWLRSIRIVSCDDMTKIADSAFKDLPYLEDVAVSHNYQLKSLSFLGGARSVKRLVLCCNKSITMLDTNMLKDLALLTTLQLTGTAIVTIPNDFFALNTNLVKIDLSSNEITNLDQFTFNGLGQLRSLNLNLNPLRNWTANSLGNLEELILPN